MSKLIIDIGNYSIRALIYTEKDHISRPVHLSLNNELLIPSVAVINDKNEVIAVGEEAMLWKQTSPEFFYHLDDISAEQCFVSVICKFCELAIELSNKFGTPVDELVVISPPNRAKISDAGIKDIQSKTKQLHVAKTTVTSGYRHVLQKCYTVQNGEYILLYDIGHAHVTAVLAKKTKDGIQIEEQKSSTDISGQIINELLFADIVSNITLPDYDDTTLALLYNSALEKSIEYVKLKCSMSETIKCPIPNTEDIYQCNQKRLGEMITKPLGDSFSMVAQMIRDCKVDPASVKQVITCGSTCRLPFIVPVLKKYLSSNLKININEIKNIATQELHSELYGCKAAINL